MNSSDFKRIAREKLKGKWGSAVCITLAYLLVLFVIAFVQNLLPETGIITSIVSIGVYVFEIPLAFGMLFAFFKLFYGDTVKAFSFWSLGFDNFGRAWGIAFRTLLKLIAPIILMIVSYIIISFFIVMTTSLFIIDSPSILMGSSFLLIFAFILLIVSGIWFTMKSYYYSLAQCVAFDNPDLSAKECVLKSKELMTKRRGKLFGLQLSFIGWGFLSIFTFFIGYIWLLPYMQMAIIAFYNAFSHEEKVETEIINEN